MTSVLFAWGWSALPCWCLSLTGLILNWILILCGYHLHANIFVRWLCDRQAEHFSYCTLLCFWLNQPFWHLLSVAFECAKVYWCTIHRLVWFNSVLFVVYMSGVIPFHLIIFLVFRYMLRFQWVSSFELFSIDNAELLLGALEDVELCVLLCCTITVLRM